MNREMQHAWVWTAGMAAFMHDHPQRRKVPSREELERWMLANWDKIAAARYVAAAALGIGETKH